MTVLPFFGYTLYEMFHYFVIWSFIGWVIEIIDMTFETGEYQNRGFLNMPICPIYGVGVLLIIAILRPFTDSYFLTFLLSMIICTALELAVGLLLEAIFHNRWWDYSHEFFNFKGLICLRNSMFWGFGCVIMLKKVQPAFEKLVAMIPFKVGIAIIIVMSVLIAVDLISSLAAMRQLTDKLRQLDTIGKKMLSVSQKIGGVLADKTIDIMELNEKIKDKAGDSAEAISDRIEWVKSLAEDESPEPEEDYRIEYSKLKAMYEKLLNEKSPADRLIKAFPTLQSKMYGTALHDLKHKVNPDASEHFELRLDEVKRVRSRHRK